MHLATGSGMREVDYLRNMGYGMKPTVSELEKQFATSPSRTLPVEQTQFPSF